MPVIDALRFVASNVESGYQPQRGRGFQPVALSPELDGTDDLRLLDQLSSYFEASPARRASGELPVKESLVRLPSGRLGIGKTVDFGLDPGGRAGNSLARWLVVEAEALAAAGGDPFPLLESGWLAEEPALPPAGNLPPVPMSVPARA